MSSKRYLFFKGIAVIALFVLMVMGTAIPVQASTKWKVITGSYIFEGTYEECKTHKEYIIENYDRCGGIEKPDKTIIALTYGFGYGKKFVRFDLVKKKMTWVDGTQWDITYTGPALVDYNNIYTVNRLNIHYTDEAVRTFCPEFAETHSLIPDDAPENFSTVLEKSKPLFYSGVGIPYNAEEKVEEQTKNSNETYETFNEKDYAERYPDVKNALGMDKSLLWNHYQNMGKAEGRTALFNAKDEYVSESYETFNEKDYAERYPDVKNALGTDKGVLWNHYQNMGKAEGRVAYFDVVK
ncbi:MAG: hypothetical protein IKY94_08705 [Lachnospiraceae bacterium]|nr:hypothetical protein [Lachnospiraceae bacterium]